MYNRDDLPAALSGTGSGGGALDALLDEDEVLQYVLSSTDAIEHTTSGRTTTLKPGGGHDAFMMVTDERVLFVLGDQPDEGEIVFSLPEVDDARHISGLLSSKVVLDTPEEKVEFVPSDGDTEDAVSYVDRIGDAWAELDSLLAKVDGRLDELTDAIQGDGDEQDIRLRTQSHLSNANHCATREPDAPTEKMRSRIAPYEAKLEHTEVYAWMDRAEETLEAARSQLADGAFADACKTTTEAGDSLTQVSESLDDLEDPPETTEERLADLEAELGAVADEILSAANEHCAAATNADDPERELEAWITAHEHYRGALDADWNGQVGVSPDEIQFQLAWIDGNLVRTLRTEADRLEAEGDELGEDTDEAGDRYDEALDYLERAQDIVADLPDYDADGLADDVDRVEEKAQVSEWQWGDA